MSKELSIFLKNRLAALKIIKADGVSDTERRTQNVQVGINLSGSAASLRAAGDTENADKMQELADGYKTL